MSCHVVFYFSYFYYPIFIFMFLFIMSLLSSYRIFIVMLSLSSFFYYYCSLFITNIIFIIINVIILFQAHPKTLSRPRAVEPAAQAVRPSSRHLAARRHRPRPAVSFPASPAASLPCSREIGARSPALGFSFSSRGPLAPGLACFYFSPA